ncbi:ABC transporter permease [Carboxydochorda subterranea]|uniref:ABC transporter permease n=1 Tax=Carboxydichorda subterranea TaxID=3109565 RepID=A0ABZ1BZB4_9FIRM|nr:ABC transporter permease [Limnochorda sp. L945t]WRP18146.1 ABC transporter permease [Limnochorda sp. L945t]
MGTFRAVLRNRKAAWGLGILGFFVAVALLAPVIAPTSPSAMAFAPSEPPSWRHPLGTTATGQDIFAQVVWGSRLSLVVGLVTGAAATLLSVVVGLTAGYAGGVLDDVLTTLTNIFLVLPGLPLMIIVAAYVKVKGVVPIILVISVTGWAWGARLLRAQAMSLKSRDFVQASVVVGERPARIVFGELLPNLSGLIAANFFGAAVYAVLSEASLEFLGLGNVNVVTWGTMLYWAQNNQAILLGQWQWMAVPGLCIALLGTAFALINFAVDEVANPRLRVR